MGYSRTTVSKTDDNHKEIVKMFRDCGWVVLDVHTLKDCCDIFISRAFQTIAVEIKDGKKKPSARKLTPGELKFRQNWLGHYRLVESIEDVMDINQEFFGAKR
tara:strand:- start:5904 stop:6212 length:309 start_codon:yes stop_codon:yes gene_type:complete